MKPLFIQTLLMIFLLSVFYQARRSLISRLPRAPIDLLRGKNNLDVFFVPNSGIEKAFDPVANQLADIIHKNGIKDFGIIDHSEMLNQGYIAYQRILDRLYPLAPKTTSAFQIGLNSTFDNNPQFTIKKVYFKGKDISLVQIERNQ